MRRPASQRLLDISHGAMPRLSERLLHVTTRAQATLPSDDGKEANSGYNVHRYRIIDRRASDSTGFCRTGMC